ncbi:hypothetical protein PHYSODRAFT_394331, partial [Phytophthora sojae]
ISCSIVGVPEDVFSVQLNENESVHDLKTAISAEKQDDLKNVAAYRLRLFLAKKDDGEWLTINDVKNGAR